MVKSGGVARQLFFFFLLITIMVSSAQSAVGKRSAWLVI